MSLAVSLPWLPYYPFATQQPVIFKMQTWLCHSSAVDVALRIKTKILNWPIKWVWSDPCRPFQSCPPLLCPHWPPLMCPQCLCTCYFLCLASFQVTPPTLHLLSTYSICSVYLLMHHKLPPNLAAYNNEYLTLSQCGNQKFGQASEWFFWSSWHQLRSLGGIKLMNGLVWKYTVQFSSH